MGAKDKAIRPVWQFAPDAPLEARPYGGTITVKYPSNTINYKYDRKTNTYLRSVTGEKKETDAANGERIAPKNVIVMRMHFGPLNDGHPGASTDSRRRHRQRHGLDLHERKDDQGHLEEDRRSRSRRGSTTASGNEVTLTIGQTFVQVMPTSTSPLLQGGHRTPPASATPSGSPTPR